MESKVFNYNKTADETLPKIFCFINGRNSIGHFPCALAEDGNVLGGHCSSNEWFAKHDIGFNNSDRKHDNYKKHYPDGYELIWLESHELDSNEGFQKACEKNRKLNPEGDSSKEAGKQNN